MKNPVYAEYRKIVLFGYILAAALAIAAAVIHYLLSVDDRVVQSKALLNALSSQLDSQFVPLMAFAQTVQQAAQLKLMLEPAPGNDATIPLLSVQSGETVEQEVTADAEQLGEWQMLQRLQPYFELAPGTQPFLKGMYYLSEQGFAYNGQHRWSDYISEQFIEWHTVSSKDWNFDRNSAFFTDFLQQQSAMAVPLYYQHKKVGRFLFALDLKQLLIPMYEKYPASHFMLLDQSGNLIVSTTERKLQNVDHHMLQIKRLDSVPWSLAVLEQKSSLFTAGVAQAFWRGVSYFLVLVVMLLALQYRYRRRTLSPTCRLLIHIDRLSNGEIQGVRHIPQGWTAVFEKVNQLKSQNADPDTN